MTRTRVLVAGASGFVGRRLVPLLSAEADVITIRREALPGAGERVTVLSGMEAGWTRTLPPADIVVWLAQSRRYRDFPAGAADMFAVNLAAFFELIDWATRSGVRRIVYASSGSVYVRTGGLLSESGRTAATTMYAATKLCAEQLLAQYAGVLEVITARVFAVYGPGQTGMAVANVVDAVLAHRPVALTDGLGMTFTPIFVDDAAAVFSALTEVTLLAHSCVINVAGPEIVTLADVAAHAGRLSGRAPEILPTAGTAPHLAADTALLAELLPGVRRRSLCDGLAATVRDHHAQHERSK